MVIERRDIPYFILKMKIIFKSHQLKSVINEIFQYTWIINYRFKVTCEVKENDTYVTLNIYYWVNGWKEVLECPNIKLPKTTIPIGVSYYNQIDDINNESWNPILNELITVATQIIDGP